MGTASTYPVVADMKLSQSLDPELSRLLAKGEITRCSKGDEDDDCNGVSATSSSLTDRIGGAAWLSRRLSEMLAKDAASPEEDKEGGLRYFLDVPLPTVLDESSF